MYPDGSESNESMYLDGTESYESMTLTAPRVMRVCIPGINKSMLLIALRVTRAGYLDYRR